MFENISGTSYPVPMQSALLSRRPHRADPGQPFLGGLHLARARAHEATGPSRHTLAMMIAGAMTGPVFWVAPNWAPAQLYAPGMLRFADPGRFTFIAAPRAEDVLWTLEEVLRSGVVPLVVGDLPAPPGLTAVRRLHLAGETGAREGAVAPIALLLTQGGTAPGVETRWHMTPSHAPGGQESWTLTRARARTAPPRSWTVRPAATGFTLAD